MNRNITINNRPLFFTHTEFDDLMKNRIYRILLISSNYDAFILEDDGRINELIFQEYISLNLRYPPQFIQVNTEEKALRTLDEEFIDLIIIMGSADIDKTYELAAHLKEKNSEIPIVFLSPYSREFSMKIHENKQGNFDYFFSWLGQSDILLAIIKLIEDKMNVDTDIEQGVQVILLVEDSIRFYSSYLPQIYKLVYRQSQNSTYEALNAHQQMLKMRGRPKILLATDYEEAENLYNKYKDNLLGVISDVRYNYKGEKDGEAGFKLSKMIRKESPFMPILLQSSEEKNREKSKCCQVGFIHKNSKHLHRELKDFIVNHFAFGAFVFRNPDNEEEELRANNLLELQNVIFKVSDQSLFFHTSQNHLSKWLNARALFPIASAFKQLKVTDFTDLQEIRKFIFEAIALYKSSKSKGIIAQFDRSSFNKYNSFTRIGNGSIGGKARGLAFLDTIIKRYPLLNSFENVNVTIPKTLVISTDIFDEFMEKNALYDKVLGAKLADNYVLEQFLNATFPEEVRKDLKKFLDVVEKPLAIRSSSLLEDSYYQPFAGVYSTYMIPLSKRKKENLQNLLKAIKGVYASAFYQESKAYMEVTQNVIDEEKMAVVIQEVCGKTYGKAFYPTISGVARSTNFYPIENEKPEEGIINIALGLGKHVVEGGQTLRFSPNHPKKVLQLSDPQLALKETQKTFCALDLNTDKLEDSTDDGINIKKMAVSECTEHRSVSLVSSVFDYHTNRLTESSTAKGLKLVTFSKILKYDTFPLAKIIKRSLEMGQQEMGMPVEIEFAVNLDVPKGDYVTFNLLQIRPIVDNMENLNINMDVYDQKKCAIFSKSVLGNGEVNDVTDVIYVKPENFDASNNVKIAEIIGQLNKKYVAKNRNYILIGPGRWGSSDHWLGIPVKWANISAARLIIESGLKDYRVDPSQGTHFFQNLTSFKVSYFTINPFMNDGWLDIDYLNQQEAVFENEFIRQVSFEKPLRILTDGRKQVGLVLKHDQEIEGIIS